MIRATWRRSSSPTFGPWLSIGVVTFDPQTLPREMLLRVDEALTAARRNGGNRITVNETELRDITAMV